MASTLRLSTHLPADPNRVWAEVQTSRLLHYVARRLIRFAPADGRAFPEIWEAGEHKAWMLLLGFLPLGWQVIGIEFPSTEGPARKLRDNGRGMMIRTWDHMITVEPEGAGTRYTDEVTIDAAILTPIIALFARLFYAHRQKRWRRLVARDFRYD